MLRAPRPTPMTLNLAPMVDVMMCLIIFFLLASRLVEQQRRPLELAAASSLRDPEELSDAAGIVVNVRPGPAPPAEYVIYGWDGERMREQVLTPGELDQLLIRRALHARHTGLTPRCVIRADRRVRYGDVEVVLRACGRARISEVTFAAQPLEDGA